MLPRSACLVSIEPFIPHETQIDVIGQTARVFMLFHKHSCRLNWMYVSDMNNETLIKMLADMNKATLTAIKIPFFPPVIKKNCAWRSDFIMA